MKDNAWKYDDWLDHDGFMHTKKYPALDQSENSPMFSGLFSCVYPSAQFVTKAMTLYDTEGNFRANRMRKMGSHFSHDNMTGLYCYMKRRYGKVPEHFPICKWNSKYWLHPRDLAFYFWVHYPRLGYLTLWIASLAMMVSCIQTYKVRNGKRIIKSDGKLLAYMRCKSFNMSITFAACTFIISRHKHFGSWNSVAKMYFKEEGHPLRSLIK